MGACECPGLRRAGAARRRGGSLRRSAARIEARGGGRRTHADGLRRDAALRRRLQPRQAGRCAGPDEVTVVGDGRDWWPTGDDPGLVRHVQPATATFTPPRTEEEDTEILLDAFGELATHAEAEGVVIALEPLNRYENHMINTL